MSHDDVLWVWKCIHVGSVDVIKSEREHFTTSASGDVPAITLGIGTVGISFLMWPNLGSLENAAPIGLTVVNRGYTIIKIYYQPAIYSARCADCYCHSGVTLVTVTLLG